MNTSSFNENVQDSFGKAFCATGMRWAEMHKYLLLLKMIEDHPNESVPIVDLGCGTTRAYEFLQQNLSKVNKTFKYYGLDLRITNTDIAENISLRHADIFKSVSDGSIKDLCVNSIICLFDVIEHMESKQMGLDLLDLVMSTNPYSIAITTPNKRAEVLEWPDYHEYEYSLVELKQFFQHKPFSIENVFGLHVDDETYDDHNSEGVLDKAFPKYYAKSIKILQIPIYAKNIWISLQKS